jgi:hypothetical protein
MEEFNFTRLFGLYLNPFNADTDGDGLSDGNEVGTDGFVTNGSHIMYAATTLSTNAVEDSNNLRLRFTGRYLDGIWNFGSNSTTRVSINGDIVEVANTDTSITDPIVPTRDCAEAVLTNIAPGLMHQSISMGEPINARVFADSDPSMVDTDLDNMWDGFEFNHQYMTNAFGFAVRILDPIGRGNNSSDPDADGLNNEFEFIGPDGIANSLDSTDPRTGDTDGDGMPDGWEYFYALDPNSQADTQLDPDNDMLPNLAEYQNGTNPRLYDSDGDGLSDGEEVLVYGTSPINPDSDGDGIFDLIELVLGTDPLDVDTDKDGMPDGFEVLDFNGNLRPINERLNPLSPSDADDDYDGDGLTNLEEYLVRNNLLGASCDPSLIWDYTTDPFNADTDADGMPDGWEVYYCLHPIDPILDTTGKPVTRNSTLGPDGDLDADGVWNLREFQYRFRLNPNASEFGILDYSMDPRNPDTDNDGLWDGEEDRVFGTDAIRQDTDRDHLFDGAGLEPRWGEVETERRTSIFQIVSCGGCTWEQAVAIASTNYYPFYPFSQGELAVLSDSNEQALVTSLITPAHTNIALGGEISSEGGFNWVNYEFPLFQNFITPEPTNKPGYLGLNNLGVWTSYSSNDVFDSFVLEWPNIPVVSNHYDMALNDLWQLRWPSASPLPFWVKVNVATNSPIPPPRWGAAASYVPVYETKNPRNQYPVLNSTSNMILMDNRQLVIFGGRDGINKHSDVWEFVIRSNLWARSVAPMNGLPPGFLAGLSEMSAIPLFVNGHSGCKSVFDDRGIFGFPKSRPWSDSRSLDWTFFFGGWNNGYSYNSVGNPWFYKSTDDPRPLTESQFPNTGDAGVTEFFKVNIPPDPLDVIGASTLNEGTRFAIGNNIGLPLDEPDDNGTNDTRSITGYSALNIDNFNLSDECDEILSAQLILDVRFIQGAPIDVLVSAEAIGGSSSVEYSSEPDEEEPSFRFGIGPVTNFTINATGQLEIDVTPLIQNVVGALFGEGPNLGFVFNSPSAVGFALISTTTSAIRVTYKPSYKIEPRWVPPNTISTLSFGQPISQRKSQALAFDIDRQRMVLFGGIDGNVVLDDTHEGAVSFNGAGQPIGVSWTQQVVENKPPARYAHSMIYDANNDRMLMFGGFNSNHVPLNDLWQYAVTNVEVSDGESNSTVTVSTWSQITSFSSSDRPQPRAGASMVYYGDFDYNRAIEGYCVGGNQQRLVLFGGTDGKTYFNDTWVYNGSRWILVQPAGEQSQGPSPRAYATLVWAQNAGNTPDPDGFGDYTANDDPPCAIPAALLFGGRVGTLPTGKDTDADMVEDGVEHSVGGTVAGRDPRINKLIVVDHPTETVPFSFNRIGPMAGLSRGTIANFESLRNVDAVYGGPLGLPVEEYPDAESQGVSVTVPANAYGVDAQLVDHFNLWYHRAAYGDPNDVQDVWELGVPNHPNAGNSSPPYAYSGRWVYGTKLIGDYPNSAVMDLFSPKFDLRIESANSTDPSNSNAFFLVYQEWLDLADANDYVEIDVIRPETGSDVNTRVSGTNKPSVRILGPRHFSDNTTGAWRRVVVPLSPVANEANLFLRFRLWSDAENAAGGWYIDDVAIMQGGQISGILTNFGPGINVDLQGANDAWIIGDNITSENGEFSFGLLPIGNYLLGSQSTTSSVISISAGSWSMPMVNIPVTTLSFSLMNFMTSMNTIYWEASIGMSYQVEYVDSIDGVWTPLGAPVVAASVLESAIDPGPIPSHRFYRVKALNQP